MSEFKFEIEEKLLVLSENDKGWTKELNRVSFNGAPAKYDIRSWSPDHTKMGKGITLSNEEFQVLVDAFKAQKITNRIKAREWEAVALWAIVDGSLFAVENKEILHKNLKIRFQNVILLNIEIVYIHIVSLEF